MGNINRRALLIGFIISINLTALIASANEVNTLELNGDLPVELNNKHQSLRRDFRWPNRQLNVLIDSKSLNESEIQILENMLDQLELKTCLHVNRLPADKINPFDAAKHLADSERNFIYIFKSQVGAFNRHPSLGLSSFGCTHQGRQSLVLTELAFRWPELVLRYHLMRSLGLENLERPDGPVRKLLNILPLSQKISNSDQLDLDDLPVKPTFMVSSSPSKTNQNQSSQLMAKRLHLALQGPPEQQVVGYLSQEDLSNIKELYNCSDYQNKLSPKPLNLSQQTTTTDDQLYSQANSLLGGKLNADTIPATSKLSDDDDDQVKKLDEAEESLDKIIEALEEGKKDQINDTMIDDAAKHIVDYLLAEDGSKQKEVPAAATMTETTTTTTTISSPPREQCNPTDTCPMGRSTDSTPANGPLQERPMLLKLDEFHAQDPHLQQANQMKLSQFSNDSLATYRLMGDGTQQPPPFQQQQPLLQQQQQQQLFQQQPTGQLPAPKSEMLISFEQANNNQPAMGQSAIDTLASSQVLKLCSCTCQTMSPVKPPPAPTNNGYDQSTNLPPTMATTTTMGPALPPFTFGPATPPPTVYPTYPPVVYPTYPPVVYPTYPTSYPYYTTPRPTFPTATLDPNDYTIFPSTWQPDRNDTNLPMTSIDFGEPTTTELEPLETTTAQPPTETTTTSQPPQTTTTTAPNINSMISNACQQVEWVKPNKTVYASAKIVWDVDRANQNYFLCQNLKDGELIPGKTHGFSCKVSSQGKAFEMHNFNVLIKPENVQLAWVQKSSSSFGKTNFPVIGGYSRDNAGAPDPYIVSRCLVKDENNDVITLIGYVNNQGVGWFPFDDIQIECSQYDVLACVN